MWRVTKGLLGVLVFSGILLGGLELGLRAFPGTLIPAGWLKSFRSELRVTIAQRLALPNKSQMWELPRDDGGPPLMLYKPRAHTEQKFSAAERSSVRRDAQGFCNPPRDSYDRPSIDVFIMGDSFTGCIAAAREKTWMSRIGQITGLSVYNIGRGGIGPYDYLQIFRHFGPAKTPKIGLMNFYEGNDLRDSVRYQEHVDKVRKGDQGYANAADRYEPELDYEGLLNHPLGRNSYVANLGLVAIGKAYEGIRNAIARASGRKSKVVDFHYTLRFADGASVPFNVQNADQAEVRYALRLRQGDVQLSALDAALERFAVLGREHGFLPVVSYAPSAYTAYADFVAFDDEALTELMPWFSGTQRDYLRRKTEELGIVFIDLTPALQEAARQLQDKDLLYFPVSVHYTPTGHRVAGEAIAEALTHLQLPGL